MDRPIIFSAPMIRAIRREIAAPGTGKTQTRRIVRFPGWAAGIFTDQLKIEVETDAAGRAPEVICEATGCLAALPLPYAVGDRLWVKENWRTSVGCDDRRPSSMEVPGGGYGWPVWYEADGGVVTWRGSDNGGPAFVNPGKLRPSIHMSRWASRLTLLVTDVRVERLTDISREDAIAEGCIVVRNACNVFEGTGYHKAGLCHSSPVTAFGILWDDIHGPDAWDANPWVVAVSFQPFETNIDRMPERQAAPVHAAAE